MLVKSSFLFAQDLLMILFLLDRQPNPLRADSILPTSFAQGCFSRGTPAFFGQRQSIALPVGDFHPVAKNWLIIPPIFGESPKKPRADGSFFLPLQTGGLSRPPLREGRRRLLSGNTKEAFGASWLAA